MRQGRPRKEWTDKDIEKMEITDDVISQLKYNAGLSPEQVETLKKTLDDTLKQYNLEKEVVKDEDKSIKDINAEALEDFLNSKRVESKSKCTIYNYGNEISKMFIILNKDYREITSDDIRKYMNYRKEHDGLANVTIHNIRMYLMSFYKWCTIEERVRRNPMDKIGVVKTEKKVIETLSDEEAEIIRCACQNERDLAIIDLLSGSGMRVSELSGLNIRDVNFETGEIKVFGKGSKERICFLTGKAKVHLKWYLEQRTDDNEALFVTAKHPYNRLGKNGVEFILKSIAKRSRIPRTRLYPHKYRSTLATNMINKGADASQVQNILGHQSVDTTLKCYARVDTNTVKQAHHTYVS